MCNFLHFSAYATKHKKYDTFWIYSFTQIIYMFIKLINFVITFLIFVPFSLIYILGNRGDSLMNTKLSCSDYFWGRFSNIYILGKCPLKLINLVITFLICFHIIKKTFYYLVIFLSFFKCIIT